MKRVVLLTSLLAARLLAGGFFLELGNPEANAEAKALHAVAVVRTVGCHDPTQAKLTATATGLVEGQRRTFPLTLAPLATPGTYALTQQLPAAGNFVITLVGTNAGATTTLIVRAGHHGVERQTAQWFPRPLTSEEVAAALP